jgi:hypothetical protein
MGRRQFCMMFHFLVDEVLRLVIFCTTFQISVEKMTRFLSKAAQLARDRASGCHFFFFERP